MNAAIDPEVADYLQSNNFAAEHDLAQYPLALVRDAFVQLYSEGSGQRVYSVSDRQFGYLDQAVPVRVYRPSPSPNLPVMIFYHGGGWVLGDLDSHDGLCRKIAMAAHCAVVSVGYRRAPEVKYPGPLEDAYAALCWVALQADELGINPARIVVAGDSAGGNLAAAVCILARERSGPAILHQCLWYPVLDLSNMDRPSYRKFSTGYPLTLADMQWFKACYLSADAQALSHYVSPLLAIDLSGLPPATIVTAAYDVLHDEGYAYAEALKAGLVDVEYICFDALFHGFLSFNDFSPASRAFDFIFSNLYKRLWG